MNHKKLKKIKHLKKMHNAHSVGYIEQLQRFKKIFEPFSAIAFLINQILISDKAIQQQELPNALPYLQLPDDIQQVIFEQINQKYPLGNPKGDQLWNKYNNLLPKLDHLLRSYRDYLEETYGMWAYISKPFINDLAKYLNHESTLEIMAGNGVISAGLRKYHENIIATDSLEWINENETGKHLWTDVKKMDALTAIEQFGSQVKYVIMSWSPDGVPIDMKVLEKLRTLNPQPILICIGEQNGATNSHEFWQNAQMVDATNTEKLNSHHQSFDLINEKVFLVK